MAKLCLKCGTTLADVLADAGADYHYLCRPENSGFFGDPEAVADKFTNGDPYASRLRNDLTEIIRWADRGSTRNRQRELGASEVGVSCLRRLGYGLAGVADVNHDNDPWPAIVGTAVHTWLEGAVNSYEEAHRLGRWTTEMTVKAGPIPGHTDLYDSKEFGVVDYKNPGTTAMTEIRKGHVDQQYIEQVQMYGYGHVQAGRRVDRVALVFFPRAGYLQGTYVWSQPYDEKVALSALDRVNKVAAGLLYYKVEDFPDNWEKVPATPSKSCTWCDWYRPEADAASDAGCPGR